MNSISKIALNNTVYDIEDKEARNSYKPNLLEFKWSDHLLNNVSWLRADTFSWQDGGVYEDAYNELLSEYNNSSSVETIDHILSQPIKLPTFTANTTDGITVSDARNNTNAYTLINGVSMKQIGHWSDYWFSINYGYSTVIKSYTIKADSSGAPEYPSMWELQGSNDGTNWQDLDYKVDEVFSLGEEKTYELDGSGFSNYTWKMYRILFHNGVEASSNGELGKISFNVQKVLEYVSYKRTPKGYKIANKLQESAISEMYINTGVAWYYILDTANTRFKLPRTKYGFVGLRDSVGNYIPESLPNITGNVAATNWEDGANNTGAFSTNDSKRASIANRDSYRATASFDASRSSSTYQDNAPVQQRATQMYLYFYVGQFSQSAIEQTAGLNAELFNGKLDLDLGNIPNTSKETVVGWGIPDYTAGISRTSGTQYTADTNGYIMAQCFQNATSGGTFITCIINGITIPFTPTATDYGRSQIYLPIKKGDIYTITANSGIYFFRIEDNKNVKIC